MKKKKRRKKLIIAGVVIAVIVVLVVLVINQSKKAVDNLYSTAVVTRGDMDIFYSFSGNTQLSDVKNVVSAQSWKLTQIHVKEGDKIKKGDILYTIDEEDYKLAVASAESAIETAKLSLSSTQANMNQQISQAQGTLNQAKLSLDDAERTLTQTSSLFEAGLASEQSYNQAKTAYDLANEQYNTANSAYQSLRNTSNINVASAQAQVTQAQNSYDSLVKQIGDREVKIQEAL